MCDVAINKSHRLQRLANLTPFLTSWHKEKRVATIDKLDVYNREVSKFSQKLIVITAILVEKLSAIKL